MKSYTSFCILILLLVAIGVMHSCKKDSLVPTYTQPPPLNTTPVTTTYTEEFEDVTTLVPKGWAIGEYSQADTIGTTAWVQGDFGSVFKGDTTWYGFSAFSYKLSPFEYLYSFNPAYDSTLSISSWLLTPVLKARNGDKISFYTRGDTTGLYTNRLQVLQNNTASTFIGHDLNSVGDFTVVLDDINASQAPGGYPTTWKKYEYTIAGLPGQTNIRIALRHYVINPKNARGIGIDQFKFEVN
jgi:hypothetical protein